MLKSLAGSMALIWILIGITALGALAFGSPQHKGIALSFPEELDDGTDYGGLEEFYDDQDAKIWLPRNQNDLGESYDNPDDPYGYYIDKPGAVLEPSTFVSEDGYLELPDWMDIDFNKVPADKLGLLNNASDLADLAVLFGLDQENTDKLSMPQTSEDHTKSRNSGVVGVNSVSPVFARCEPEHVKVVLEVGANTRYLPGCVRLMRCGGCCNNDLISCQPTKSEILTLEVMKLTRGVRSVRGRSRGRRTSGNWVKIQAENHLECSCQCKVQETHCKPALHNYNKAACACVCKDEYKKRICSANSRLQRWNKDTCTCMCHTVKQCGNGEYFSHDTCNCEQVG